MVTYLKFTTPECVNKAKHIQIILLFKYIILKSMYQVLFPVHMSLMTSAEEKSS